MTTFDHCVEAARDALGSAIASEPGAPFAPGDVHVSGEVNLRALTRSVLTALSEHTGSPRTVDEIVRVLAEVG